MNIDSIEELIEHLESDVSVDDQQILGMIYIIALEVKELKDRFDEFMEYRSL